MEEEEEGGEIVDVDFDGSVQSEEDVQEVTEGECVSRFVCTLEDDEDNGDECKRASKRMGGGHMALSRP